MSGPPSITGGLLVVAAHPDDEVLLAGGTLAASAAAALPTTVVCLTRGELGPIADPALASRETLAAVRLAELEASCAELGVGWVKCYRRQDGHLPWADGAAIVRQLERILRVRRPSAVITFGEDGLYWHPDHIATYRFTLRAVKRVDPRPAVYRAVWPKALSRELVDELERRGLPTDLWGLGPEDFGVDDEDRVGEIVVDVRRFATRKLRALRRHRTQLDRDHALAALPEEIAERFFGLERFVPLLIGSAVDGWLERSLGGASVG